MAIVKGLNNIIDDNIELQLINDRVNDEIMWDEAHSKFEMNDKVYKIGDNVLIQSKGINKIIHIIRNSTNNKFYCGVRPYLSAKTIKNKLKDNREEIESIFKEYGIKDEDKILEQRINWSPMKHILSAVNGGFHTEYEWDLNINHSLSKIQEKYQCNQHIWYYNNNHKFEKYQIIKEFPAHLWMTTDNKSGQLKPKNPRLIQSSPWPIKRENGRKRKLNFHYNNGDHDEIEMIADDECNKVDEPQRKKQKVDSSALLELRRTKDMQRENYITNLVKENQMLQKQNQEQKKEIHQLKKKLQDVVEGESLAPTLLFED